MRRNIVVGLAGATFVAGGALWTTTAQVRYIEPIGAFTQVVTTTDPLSHVFTYSLVETDTAPADLLQSLERSMNPILANVGATLYSVWILVEIPDSALFQGLTETQLALMAAWPNQDDVQVSTLETPR